MPTDIEIAQAASLKPIGEIAASLGLSDELLEPYGKYKAKVDARALASRPMNGRLVLVTAINPTPAGEGKTTVVVELDSALKQKPYHIMYRRVEVL